MNWVNLGQKSDPKAEGFSKTAKSETNNAVELLGQYLDVLMKSGTGIMLPSTTNRPE